MPQVSGGAFSPLHVEDDEELQGPHCGGPDLRAAASSGKIGFANISMGDHGFLDECTEGGRMLLNALRQLPRETPGNVIQVPGWRHGDSQLHHERNQLSFM